MNWLPLLGTLTPILLALLGGVGWLYRHERERRAAIERQLSKDKYNTYIELINIFFDVFKGVKRDDQPNGEELMERMIDANKELVIYGSDDVVKTYFEWLSTARNGTMDMELFGEVIIAIRRDMGNPDTSVTSHNFLRMILTDFDEMRAKGQLKQQIEAS